MGGGGGVVFGEVVVGRAVRRAHALLLLHLLLLLVERGRRRRRGVRRGRGASVDDGRDAAGRRGGDLDELDDGVGCAEVDAAVGGLVLEAERGAEGGVCGDEVEHGVGVCVRAGAQRPASLCTPPTAN